MYRLALHLALVACMLFLPEAYSIRVSFSAHNDIGSVGVSNIYNLEDNKSANEGISASLGQVGISNIRSIPGTGNIKASQNATNTTENTTSTANVTKNMINATINATNLFAIRS